MAAEQPEIGDRGMRAVEQAQLHLLERPDVAHHGDAELFPGRPPGGKLVLDHPLAERLGHHRPGVLDAERLRNPRAVGIGRRRHDAVDHARRAGHVLGDMAGKRRIAKRGELDEQAVQRRAIGGKVVAGKDREGRRSRSAAARQRLDEKAVRGLRLARRRKVGDDARMRRVEVAGRVAQIGLFGDRQRDDPDARIGERVEQRRRDLAARPAPTGSSR